MADSGNLIMWAIKQVAERDGVSRQAVSKNVAKLLDAGHELPVERDTRGRIVKISVAHYDHHRGQFGNPAMQRKSVDAAGDGQGSAPGAGLTGNDSRDEAMRQEAWLNLARKRLQHDEEMARLVRVDRLTDALRVVGRTIQREIGRLPNKADEVALAVSREGEHGARLALRAIAAEIGTAIADELAKVADGAPVADEPISETEQ